MRLQRISGELFDEFYQYQRYEQYLPGPPCHTQAEVSSITKQISGWFGRFDQLCHDPGSAVPEAPVEHLMGHIGHPQFTQVFSVAVCLANVGYDQSATWFENAYGFVQGFISIFALRDIMDGKTGEDKIKKVVSEGKL